jgi:hypothetical protein
MQMLFWRKNVEDGHCPSPGSLQPPELSLISYVKPMENILPLSPRLGQGKLATLRCENQKIRHKNKMVPNTLCANLVSLSLPVNKYPTKVQNLGKI